MQNFNYIIFKNVTIEMTYVHQVDGWLIGHNFNIIYLKDYSDL